MVTTIYDSDLPNEHLSVIGKIFLNWSLLEFILTRIISSLLNVDYKTGRIITRTMNCATKILKIKRLAKHTQVENLINLHKIIEKIERAREKRNDIAHGVWAQDNDNNYYIVKYSHRSPQDPIKIKMSIDELNLIYEDVNSALGELMSWEQNLSLSRI
jgi:hypothetical protein